MSRSARILAAALTAALAFAARLEAQTLYKDAKYGFSSLTVKDWKQIPTQPSERYVIAKWASQGEIRELPGQMHIFAFARHPQVKRPKIEGAEKPAGGYDTDELLAHFGPKTSFSGYLEEDHERRKMKLDGGKPFKVKTPSDKTATGTLYETKRDSGYSRGSVGAGDFYVVIAVVDTDDWEFALELSVHEKATKNYRDEFLSVAKSFAITGAVNDTPSAPATGLSAREEARKVARENATRVAGWWYEETENYLILTNVPKAKMTFMADLKTRLETIRKVYEKDFPPAGPIDAVSIVRVCDSRKTYSDYGGPGGTAGYWAAHEKELVLFFDSEKNTTWSVLNHEAFHQYIHYSCGKIDPASWYNEGYGDYYAGAKIQGSKLIEIGPFRWREDLIKGAIREGTHVPLKDIIKFSQGDYYSRADLCYAEGWSMIYFFNKALPEGHPWGKILPTYFSVLKETKSEEKAVHDAFKDVEMDKLEAAWAAFITKGQRVLK